MRGLHSFGLAAVISVFAAPASADCRCDCLRSDRTVVASQTVQNKWQCQQACNFVSRNVGYPLIQSDNCPTGGNSGGPVGPPPFPIAQECTPGPPPADAIPGNNAFMDHAGGPNPNVVHSCVMLEPGHKISKIWCHIVNDHPPNDAYWCRFPAGAGRPSEEMCGLWGDAKAWPDYVFQPFQSKRAPGKVEVCARAVNWSDWANRHFQIFAK